LPDNLHLVPLPAYSPELNPIERLWDVAKDPICNRVFDALDAIEEKLTEALRPYWEQPAVARSLVGDGRLHTQANATFGNFIPDSFFKMVLDCIPIQLQKTAITHKPCLR
jgi:hypothetical protein